MPGSLVPFVVMRRPPPPRVAPPQFELYVSPPRAVLKAASSLSDAGLVPAALVYVSWREVPPAGERGRKNREPQKPRTATANRNLCM